MKTAIKSNKIITNNRLVNGFVVVQKNKIFDVVQGELNVQVDEIINVEGKYVSPGFIDMHTHGGGGHDFMDGSVECFIEAAKAHMERGTTCILPTTLTCAMKELYKTIDCFKTAKKKMKCGPELFGLHLEGPYFSEDQLGAQDKKYIKPPNKNEYCAIIDYAQGEIKRWSVAVELEGAIEMGDYLLKNNILGSIAHSNAELETVEEAFEHGFTLLTHFYSAMSTITRKHCYRHLGVVESGYLIDNIDIEIIADGYHLPKKLLQMICKLKDNNRISLITDSMRGAGMPDGPSVLGSLNNGQNVIIEGGIAKLPDKSAFAGSVATADRLIRVMHKQVGLSIIEAVKMMTLNPARVLGVSDRIGKLEKNYEADIVVFDDNINVSMVFCKGLKTIDI